MPTLPCGLEFDPSRGGCCKRNCPDERMRTCDTSQRNNPIERCHSRLKAEQYLRDAERAKKDDALDMIKDVCRLVHHQWQKGEGRLLTCARCGATKMAPPEKERLKAAPDEIQ